jgi:hypothetical protein
VTETDADLRELRKMLSTPAERDFPPGRLRQREEHLMNSLLKMSRRKNGQRPLAEAHNQPTASTQTRARPAWRRPALIAAASALLIMASFAALGALRPAPAYAVTSNPDGTVTFTVHDLVDPSAATRDLHRAGLNATVLNAGEPGTCPGSTPHGHLVDGLILPGNATGETITVRPDHVPAGETLLLTVARQRGGDGVAIGTTLVAQPAPTCYAPQMAPPPPTTHAPAATPAR